MKLKNFLLTCFSAIALSASTASAQTAEVKFNVASAAIAIINPSMEVGFGKNSAITFDYVGAFSETEYLNTGKQFLLGMGVFGYRYYIQDNAHCGFFVGGEAGLNVFRMNKNLAALAANDKGEDMYDVGHGHFFGLNIGYKYPISSRFNIEASISGGWQYSMHEGYSSEGDRYVDFNPSGEWLLYKAGLYLSYRLW